MLRSKFDLSIKDDIEEEVYEPTKPEPVKQVHVTPKLPTAHGSFLSRSQISVRLSFLGKTAEGDGYTYLKATCTGMGLTDISSIKYFKHLQFVDFSNNRLNIDDLNEVTYLPFLLSLQADSNLINSAALRRTKFLQVIILNRNQINNVIEVFQTELSTLEIAYNEIEDVEFKYRMDKLRCLDLRNNFIRNITNIDLPNLDSLYLANNKIKSLVGIEKLGNLRVLHVRNNPIKNLNGFTADLEKLEYVNLRNTIVSTLKQVKKMKCLTSIRTLILKGTPLFGGPGLEGAEAGGGDAAGGDEEEDPELRVEVLVALPRLTRLNKTEVTDEEREEVKKLMLEKIEEDKDKDEEEEEEDEEKVNEEQGVAEGEKED